MLATSYTLPLSLAFAASGLLGLGCLRLIWLWHRDSENDWKYMVSQQRSDHERALKLASAEHEATISRLIGQHREELDRFMAAVGVESPADRRQREQFEMLRGTRPEWEDGQFPPSGFMPPGANATVFGQPVSGVVQDPMHEWRRQNGLPPLSRNDLTAPEDDDPIDLTNPLDDFTTYPDAVAPEGSQWAPDEPLPAPEPVPEGEWRERAAGIAPGEELVPGVPREDV